MCTDEVTIEEILIHRRHNVSQVTMNGETLDRVRQKKRAKTINIFWKNINGIMEDLFQILYDTIFKSVLIPNFHRAHVLHA